MAKVPMMVDEYTKTRYYPIYKIVWDKYASVRSHERDFCIKNKLGLTLVCNCSPFKSKTMTIPANKLRTWEFTQITNKEFYDEDGAPYKLLDYEFIPDI